MIPNIIELDHLTVTGDVQFGRNVTLRGTVIVVASKGQQINIPDGCVLENKLLSGNLTMIVGRFRDPLTSADHFSRNYEPFLLLLGQFIGL